MGGLTPKRTETRYVLPLSGTLLTTHYKNLSITTAKINDLAVTTAKITNLAVTDAKIDTLTVTKLTTGNFTAVGTITTGSLVTGAVGTNRIEITSSAITGYNSSNTAQFYLQSSNGKAYAGAGAVILDSSGLSVKGQFAAFYDATPTLTGYIFGNSGSFFVQSAAAPMYIKTVTSGSIIIQPASGYSVTVEADGAGALNLIGAAGIITSGNILPIGASQNIGATGTRYSNVWADYITATNWVNTTTYYVGGNAIMDATYFVIPYSATAPTAVVGDRSKLYYVRGGAGVADKIYCIMKDSADGYNAVQIAIG